MPRKNNYTVVGRNKAADPFAKLIAEWVKECYDKGAGESSFVLYKEEDFKSLRVDSMRQKLYSWGKATDHWVRIEDGNAENTKGYPELSEVTHLCLAVTVKKMTAEEAKQAKADRAKKAAEKELAKQAV